MTTFNSVLTSIANVEKRINHLDKEFSVMLHYLTQCKLMLENALLSTLERKPAAKHRNQALGIAITRVLESGTDEQRQVLLGLNIIERRIGQIKYILERYELRRNRLMRNLKIDAINDCVVKNISSRGNKCQLTMMFDGKTVTRHLQFRDGGWYGLPPVSTAIGFIRYEITV